MFSVIECTYELTVGDQTSTVGPGAIVFIPRNVVHSKQLDPGGGEAPCPGQASEEDQSGAAALDT